MRRGRNRFLLHPEHFQEKWNPVFRSKMRQCKDIALIALIAMPTDRQ